MMIGKLFKDRRGAIALQFAILVAPMTLAVGAAVDYSRSVHYRAELQGVADSAALAAATLWKGGTTSAAATTAANNYITAGVSRLPPNGGVTPTVATSSSNIGYSADVTLTSSMNTTFLGTVMPSIPVTVYATALNPKPYGHFCAGGASSSSGLCASNASAFSASAADTNKVYWYYVPSDGSVPADSDMTLLWSNAAHANNNPQPIPLDSNQQVGFALRNTTANYGSYTNSQGHSVQYTNQYGSAPGDTHTFYSHLVPPSNSSNGYNSSNNPGNANSVNGSTGKNCAMQVTVNNSSTGNATAPSFSGSCPDDSNTSVTQYSAPTCSQLGGKMITFYFNDMGGRTDDKDFNDGVFTYYCGGNGTGSGGSTGSTGPQSVVLIN